MSTENSVLRISYEAGEDLSSYQYHFVVLDTSTGKIRLPDSASEIALGILQDAPAAGQAGSVMLLGRSKLVANAALAIGKFVRPEYVGAADAGKGQDAGANWPYARAIVAEASSDEDELLSVDLCGPFPLGAGDHISLASIANITTAGAATYTAAQLIGKIITRDPAGGARSDVTPTAALIVAAIPQCQAGSSFDFLIVNTADAAETITVTAGSDVTLTGTMTIAQNASRWFKVVVTNAASGSEAVTICA